MNTLFTLTNNYLTVTLLFLSLGNMQHARKHNTDLVSFIWVLLFRFLSHNVNTEWTCLDLSHFWTWFVTVNNVSSSFTNCKWKQCVVVHKMLSLAYAGLSILCVLYAACNLFSASFNKLLVTKQINWKQLDCLNECIAVMHCLDTPDVNISHISQA